MPRGKGAVKTLAELRETPKLAIEDLKRDLRAFRGVRGLRRAGIQPTASLSRF
jgi:hypothetical protein